VIARRDQSDRLDRRHSTSPAADHVDHLLAVAADQLGPDPLVNDIWRQPAGHGFELARRIASSQSARRLKSDPYR
jgi:hypothetical protein